MDWTGILPLLPEDLRSSIIERADDICEIRIRAGKPSELVFAEGRTLAGSAIDIRVLRKLLLSMMDYSFYTRERELAQGFFTMKNGCRVGVCGTFAHDECGNLTMQSVGSICIRIAKEYPGCASELLREVLKNGAPDNTLIISRPGFGKTTLLRDTARQLSEMKYTVAIIDERHEIAACIDGVPTMNVGLRTDVADGCRKHIGMEILVRTMSPQVLITDEIGNSMDARAILDASGRGICVIATAHANSMDELRSGCLKALIDARTFRVIALLDEKPGNITKIWRL